MWGGDSTPPEVRLPTDDAENQEGGPEHVRHPGYLQPGPNTFLWSLIPPSLPDTEASPYNTEAGPYKYEKHEVTVTGWGGSTALSGTEWGSGITDLRRDTQNVGETRIDEERESMYETGLICKRPVKEAKKLLFAG